MANLNNVVQVSIIPSGKTLDRTNMNIVCLMTSSVGTLSSLNRTKSYTDLNSVGRDFGTTSAEYSHAKALFTQTKNPANSSGYLVLGYWRAGGETVSAQAGYLTGSQLSEATVVPAIRQIIDGSFQVTVDGAVVNVTGLNFSGVSTLKDVSDLIVVAGVTTSLVDNKIILTSNTTGATSKVSLLGAYSTGTFIGDILGLASGTGAVATNGKNSVVLAAETKEDALIEVLKEESIKGCVFIDNPTDNEAKSLATFGLANDVIFYDVFDSPTNLNSDITNAVWEITLSGGTNYRMIYRKDGDRKIATAFMARVHTVNFNAKNSTLTMNLKELKGISPENYEQDEINKAQKVGLDIYTTFGDVPKMLTSSANDFVDNIYNFIAIKNFVQIDMFNLLGNTGTKLAQTDEDLMKLVDQAEKTLKTFKNAKAIAAGTWNSPDTFGDVETFIRNIETTGYYVLAGAFSEQAQSDRENRIAPAIQIAFKNAGAIHKVDVIIQYNL